MSEVAALATLRAAGFAEGYACAVVTGTGLGAVAAALTEFDRPRLRGDPGLPRAGCQRPWRPPAPRAPRGSEGPGLRGAGACLRARRSGGDAGAARLRPAPRRPAPAAHQRLRLATAGDRTRQPRAARRPHQPVRPEPADRRDQRRPLRADDRGLRSRPAGGAPAPRPGPAAAPGRGSLRVVLRPELRDARGGPDGGHPGGRPRGHVHRARGDPGALPRPAGRGDLRGDEPRCRDRGGAPHHTETKAVAARAAEDLGRVVRAFVAALPAGGDHDG